MPDLEIDERFDLGTRLLRSGDMAQALDHFKAVYAWAEEHDLSPLMAASLCEIAWTCYKLGDSEQGLECAIGSTWLWRRLGNAEELVRALAVETVLYLDIGLADEAYELAYEATRLAAQIDDAAIAAFAHNARGLVLSVSRETALGIAALEQAMALAEPLGNLPAIAYYSLNLGFAHAKAAEEAEQLGKSETARAARATALAHSAVAIAGAQECGDFWTLRVALGNSAELLALDGNIEEALDHLTASAALPGDPGRSLRIHYLYTLGLVQQRAGRLADARAACEQAFALAESTGQVDHQLNAADKLCHVLEEQGDHAAALAMHRRFHALYVLQSGELARRRARVEDIKAENHRLRLHAADLEEQVLSDPLTGIANRRSFDQILNRLAGGPFTIAILDLDHFKRVNDQHSHIVGDAVLRRVAEILVAQIGPHGHAARLGGEEFALIFPSVPASAATAICEGVRVAVANTDWSDLAAEPLAVTISIGLAYGDGDEPSGTLMQLADRRLYMAKSGGRNRVVGDAPPPPIPVEQVRNTVGHRRRAV